MTRLMMRESTALEVKFIEETLSVAIPSPSSVVTINKDGSPLSIFSDDIWDYSATSRTLRTINFRNKIQKIISFEELDHISDFTLDKAIEFTKAFALHWINRIGSCSMSKLNGDVVAISYLISYCASKDLPLNNIFSTPEALDFLVNNVSTEKQAGLLLGKIQRFTDTTSVLSNSLFWSELAPSVDYLNKLKRVRKSFPETTDCLQTLLIPSNIYQDLLKSVINDLELFLENREKIQFIFSMRTLARDKGVSLDKGLTPERITRKQSARIQFYWMKMLQENREVSKALKHLFDVGIIENESWSGLANSLTRWQTRCAILIAAFTGMRINEILAIPLNGLKELNTERESIPVIWSTTTKLESNGTPRFTKWITSSIVQIAFDVLRIIAKGVLAWSGDREAVYSKEQEIPLFLSVEHGKHGKPHPSFAYTVAAINIGKSEKSIFKKELKISEQDIAEISWFLYGDKLPNSIQIGKSWPLGFHQFRRSMAVYAAASGYVSYPALKTQLKHISMVMTTYYSDSNSRAINILGDDLEVKALRAEWVDAKARIEADELHLLLDSNQPLAGSAGKKLMAQKVKSELPKFLDNRKNTKQAVKNGRIRYRPTLVGGCMSIKPCNKGAGVLASACISCENAVFLPGSRAALEQTKDFYEAQLVTNTPKRAREEYESNIKKINSFLKNLVETTEIPYANQ